MLRNSKPAASNASQPFSAGAGADSQHAPVNAACPTAVNTSRPRRASADRKANASKPANVGTMSNARSISILQSAQPVRINVIELTVDVEDGDAHHEHSHEH